MTRFDWPSLMRAGLGELRLTPAQFWALTPIELQLMLGTQTGILPMARNRLNALMQAFPDHNGDKPND